MQASIANIAIDPNISECIGLIPYYIEHSIAYTSAPFTVDSLHGLNRIPVTLIFTSVWYPNS